MFIVILSIFLPFKGVVEGVISLGFPLKFVSLRVNNLLYIPHGYTSILQLMTINLLTFCLDILLFYVIISIFEKIKRKIQRMKER